MESLRGDFVEYEAACRVLFCSENGLVLKCVNRETCEVDAELRSESAITGNRVVVQDGRACIVSLEIYYPPSSDAAGSSWSAAFLSR